MYSSFHINYKPVSLITDHSICSPLNKFSDYFNNSIECSNNSRLILIEKLIKICLQINDSNEVLRNSYYHR